MLLARPRIARPIGPAPLKGPGVNQRSLNFPTTLAGPSKPVTPSIQAHRHEQDPVGGGDPAIGVSSVPCQGLFSIY
jgi:hypothetical protein